MFEMEIVEKKGTSCLRLVQMAHRHASIIVWVLQTEWHIIMLSSSCEFYRHSDTSFYHHRVSSTDRVTHHHAIISCEFYRHSDTNIMLSSSCEFDRRIGML